MVAKHEDDFTIRKLREVSVHFEMFPHIRQLNFPVILTAHFEEAFYITKYEDDLTIGKLGEVCVAISTPIWCSESKRLRRVNFHSTLVVSLSSCQLLILSTCHLVNLPSSFGFIASNLRPTPLFSFTTD